MAETMGNAERTLRFSYGSGATAYFCLPEVTLAGAVSFAVVAIVLLVTTITGLPGMRARVVSSPADAVDSFTA